jgi:7-cyano-7-deazaguanine synthase in queuosine biosynthesis
MKVVLFSGGLDSFVSLIWTLQNFDDVLALHYDLGCKNSKLQLKAFRETTQDLSKFFPSLKVEISESLRFLGAYEEPDFTVPIRNTLLVFDAFKKYQPEMIILQNAQMGETSLMDRTPQHNRVLEHYLGCKIISPFENFTKTEIVAWVLSNYKQFVGIMMKTHSCFYDVEGGCWNCPACFRRWVALKLNGIENSEWDYKISRSPLVQEYKRRAEQGYYGKKRGGEILEALKTLG